MTERGRIREINNDGLVLIPEKSFACFGCMNHECKGEGFITVENPDTLPLKTGQLVEVTAPGASLLGQSLVAILPPVLAFIKGYLLTRLFFPNTGEGAAAGIGVIFLFAAAFIVYKIRKRKPARKVYRVTKIWD